MRNEYSIGQLLMTPTTRKWSDFKKYEGQQEEERRVFINFTALDQGRSRMFICECPTKETARLVARALNFYNKHRDKMNRSN